MNIAVKYAIVGMVIGGILPAFLHPLKITIFASVTGIAAHTAGALTGTLISLLIYEFKKSAL